MKDRSSIIQTSETMLHRNTQVIKSVIVAMVGMAMLFEQVMGLEVVKG